MARNEGEAGRDPERGSEERSERTNLGSARRGPLASGTETGSGAGALASGDQGDWASAGTERGGGAGEWSNPPDETSENDVGSKHGHAMSDLRDHQTGGSNYERTGDDLHDGMGGHTTSGSHSSNREG